ncbi:MAG: Csu type fimbrial protein, partial [Steroidobacteraceae bacterium]
MWKLIRNFAVSVVACFVTVSTAYAGASPQTTTFLVSATVIKSCIVTATPLSFGSYDQIAATANTSTSTVSIQCTNGTTATIALNGGVNGTLAQRKMRDSVSTNLLNYQLYTDAAWTMVWGDGGGVTHTQSYTSSSNATVQPFTVYG